MDFSVYKLIVNRITETSLACLFPIRSHQWTDNVQNFFIGSHLVRVSQVTLIAGGFFTSWATWEAQLSEGSGDYGWLPNKS